MVSILKFRSAGGSGDSHDRVRPARLERREDGSFWEVLLWFWEIRIAEPMRRKAAVAWRAGRFRRLRPHLSLLPPWSSILVEVVVAAAAVVGWVSMVASFVRETM